MAAALAIASPNKRRRRRAKLAVASDLHSRRPRCARFRKVSAILTGYSGGSAVQSLSYAWDGNGNLTQRGDSDQGNRSEVFTYDNLDRLYTIKTTQDGTSAIETLAYDALGNIKSKTGIGGYSYDPANPHAVTRTGSTRYSYDATGNMLTAGTRTYTWSSYNLPTNLAISGGAASSFEYGPDRERISQTASGTTPMPATTHYVGGGLFEAILGSSGATYKHYIVAPTGVVAIVTQSSSTADKLEYLHRDNLGSISVITDTNRAILERINFDAFGKRVAVVPGLPGFETTRGYTGHLQLDALNLVHMNGRVYDPVIGRFLSPDPTVQAPDNTQSYNRYSYVWNNPLTYTDPSGYSLFGDIGHFFQKNWRALAAVAITAVAVVTAQAELASLALGIYSTVGAVGIAAAGGFAAGYVASNGSLTAGLIGAATAVAFFGIGQQFGSITSLDAGDYAIDVTEHGIVGGLQSVAQQSNFGSGFLAAAVPAAIPLSTDPFLGVTEAAVVGGTASELGGGKFANGAVTAAFSYGFNSELHDRLQEAYERHQEAVAQEIRDLVERGYRIEGENVRAKIPGLPDRLYDIVTTDPSGSRIGIEVKTTIASIFRINPQQIAFDVQALRGLAVTSAGPIWGVSYVGVSFGGSVNAYFSRFALALQAQEQGVQFYSRQQ